MPQCRRVIALALGAAHSCALLRNGTVRCWGSNEQGQLGGEMSAADYVVATAVSNLSGATWIAAGRYFTCAVLSGGAVSCSGANDSGQLGVGSTSSRSAFLPIAHVSHALELATGYGHACALLDGGAVSCWGDNQFNELGNDSTTSRSTPGVVPALPGVQQLSAYFAHTCALLSDHTVSCWGDNFGKELGGTTAQIAVPAAVPDLAEVVQVTTGRKHSCALFHDGTASCWGDNEFGQLGNGSLSPSSSVTPTRVLGLSNAVEIASGGLHSCARLADGKVACWGSNEVGQITGDNVFADPMPAPTWVPGVSGAIKLAAGEGHSCALLNDGSVACWGDNEFGQLGNGTFTTASAPSLVQGL